MNQEKKNLDINLSEEIAQGVYSNLVIISHSSSEFVLDFIRIMPGMPKADVKSRIVINPEHTKRFFLALQENIRKYEAQNGEIKLSQAPPSAMPGGFNGPVGDA